MAFRIPRAKGVESLNWKYKGMGGYLGLEFRRHGEQQSLLWYFSKRPIEEEAMFL